MPPTKSVGKRLKNRRKELNMTQGDVADKADISVNYYARVERGEVNPSMDIFKAILKALKTRSCDVLDF